MNAMTKTVVAGTRNWNTTLAGLINGCIQGSLAFLIEMRADGDVDFNSPWTWIGLALVVSNTVHGFLQRDAAKSSQESGVR